MNSHISGKVINPALPIPGPEVGESNPLLASFNNLKGKFYILFVIYIYVT